MIVREGNRLTHYGADMKKDGSLEWFSESCEFGTFVQPEKRRQGIGTRLLAEAMKIWPIDFKKQTYSADGLAFIEAVQSFGDQRD